jgi:L-asparagine oxygenase
VVEVRRLAKPLVQHIEAEAQKLAVAVARYGDVAAVEEAQRSAARMDPALADECLPAGDSGAVVLQGLQAAATAPGPTPPSWSEARREATALWDATMLLLAATMGRVFGWENQQDGRLVHDIVPSKGQEHKQTSGSSAGMLSPHTEDAFHPGRANVLVLGCLRNPDAVPTSLSSVRHARLSAIERALLERPVLPILLDDSYLEPEEDNEYAPPGMATLWDGDGGLRIRYDPAYTPFEQAEGEHRAAYDWLGDELDRVAVDVPLEQGEVLVIDNDIAVHGRVPFQARYDGSDRWLKRVSVRIPGGERPPGEAAEHGYGQRLIDPLAPS